MPIEKLRASGRNAAAGLALLLTVAGSAGLTGCSGRASATTTGAAAHSASQPISAGRTDATGDSSNSPYIARVDAICANYQQRAQALSQPGSSAASAQADYLDRYTDLAAAQVAAIDAVGRPAAGAARIEDLLARQRGMVAQARELASALRADELTRARQITEAARTSSAQLDGDLRAFGFRVCGSA